MERNEIARLTEALRRAGFGVVLTDLAGLDDLFRARWAYEHRN